MIDLPLILSLLIFSGIVLLLIGTYSYVQYTKDHRNLMEKIKEDGKRNVWEKVAVSHAPESGLKRLSDEIVRRYVMKTMVMLGNVLKPKKPGELSHIQKNFLRAGYRTKKASTIYFGVKGFMALLFPFIFFILQYFVFRFKIRSTNVYLLILICCALIGFYLPYIWLRIKIARRKDKLFRGFPDMLDLLVVCVEAGVGLDSAIYRVSEELKLSHKEISEELQVLNWELRAGKPRRTALKDLAQRVDLEDVHSLVTLLVQTEKFGTSIAKALRVYSDTMRSRRFQKAEEMAAKIAVKLLFPLIFFIFPALFVAILGSALIQVMHIWKR